MRKARGRLNTQEYTFDVLGQFFYGDGIYRTLSEVHWVSTSFCPFRCFDKVFLGPYLTFKIGC